MDLFGHEDPSFADDPPPLYAVACRWARQDEKWMLETWAHTLTLGLPLPTLPLWISERRAIPLELDASYEEACRVLRITEGA
jgi:hypothetical protein